MACQCFGWPCEHGTTIAEHNADSVTARIDQARADGYRDGWEQGYLRATAREEVGLPMEMQG